MHFTLVLLGLAGVSFAVPSRRANHVLHEKRAMEPSESDWIKVGRLESNHVLPMRFGLRQQNMHTLDDMLMSISHPRSPSFGKHMNADEVVAAFAPSEDTIKSVVDWLSEYGLSTDRLRLSHSRGWVEVNATAAEVEELLDTEYNVYQHYVSGATQIGCHTYSVPEHIREHIDLIGPTVHFKHDVPIKRFSEISKRSVHMHLATKHSTASAKSAPSPPNKTNLSNCSQSITPACLKALYNIDYTPVAYANNSYGIIELTDHVYVPNDLDIFYEKYAPQLIGERPALISVDGGNLKGNYSFEANGESDLDLQYASALVAPQSLTLLQVGTADNMAGSFDNWLDAVDASFCNFEGGDDPDKDGNVPKNKESCGVVAPPNVISVSYGGAEIGVTAKYAERQCSEYGKLGLQGVSVLYSSGDQGVSSAQGCLNPNAKTVKDAFKNGTVFLPDFPVGCPYVTAVGATQMKNGSTVKDPEIACNTSIYSGGGFSNIFSMPSYQADAVTNYLKNSPPPYTADQYNNSGTVRAYPDISANGAFYDVAVDGKFGPVFGTSASAPVVGAMITLINDARIAKGKGPVGFLNPSIYSKAFASAFNDITEGSNPGCGTPGFFTAKGWDPVTGVGTPDFSKLMPLFMALP